MTKARLLIVDDEKININLLVSLFKEDYELVIAKDGTQALNRAKEQRPDLALLDIVLPDVDGYHVFQKLQALFDDTIPVIFITSKREPEEEIIGLTLGAVDYITKPFNQELVKLRVEKQVEHIKIKNQLKALLSEGAG